MEDYKKPLPIITENNRPFWEATKNHELRLQKCAKCAKFWYPSGPLCPHCWSRDYEWTRVSGRGRVTSWVVFHQVYFDSFREDVPYNVAQVELEEGPRLMSGLVNIKNEEIIMDMPVEVVFEDVTEEVTLHKFRPVR